ncbi:MAG: hypothetical protein HKN21_06505 [Candidatus Eisenbacteria bacterium]|uniref:Uncharacterized protein n=1 Tax=Eiseniibacteriota bacterium TaxID=2212470 RepID=A0A7Y2E712_UNCEI|nr:hypothetical protein [Candidatus Eisenbacteria bacterium]
MARRNQPMEPLAKEICEAVRQAANEWIRNVELRDGVINGPDMDVPPGGFASRVNFATALQTKLQGRRVDLNVSRGLSQEVASAWDAWASNFRMTLRGIYPSFAAVASPRAPRTQGQGTFPLSQGMSSGEMRLGAKELERRLLTGTRLNRSSEQAQVFAQVAEWIDSSFAAWKLQAQIDGTSQSGEGDTPVFPPFVPVGPVLAGDNLPVPGPIAAVVKGPQFGLPIG